MLTRRVRRTASSAGHAGTPVATAWPTSGSATTSPGNTRDGDPISTRRSTSSAVRAGAGEPAAADRVRHGAVPDPHQLDEQRQPDARVRARRSGRCGDPRQAEMGVLRPRPSAARRDPAVAHRARGGVVRLRRPGAARTGARPAGGRPLRQPPGLLHVRRGRRPAAGPHVHADAAACASCPGAVRRAGRRTLSGDGSRRPPGSTGSTPRPSATPIRSSSSRTRPCVGCRRPR